MSHLLAPEIRVLETDAEVKSYIYQQIMEFEGFVTPQTVVSVIARDPKKLAIQLETEGKSIPLPELRKMYRIAIVLKEGDSQIQEEALDADVFVAIRMAKEKLLLRLGAIQDQVISNQERTMQINDALSNNQLH